MKHVFYDALCNGMSPETLAEEMNAALREYDAMTAKTKREAEMREAAERAADALNVYASMVDPGWEDLDAEDIQTIAEMSVLFRDTVGDILNAMFGEPAPAQAVDIHVDKPKMNADDKAIADFLSFLGL